MPPALLRNVYDALRFWIGNHKVRMHDSQTVIVTWHGREYKIYVERWG